MKPLQRKILYIVGIVLGLTLLVFGIKQREVQLRAEEQVSQSSEVEDAFDETFIGPQLPESRAIAFTQTVAQMFGINNNIANWIPASTNINVSTDEWVAGKGEIIPSEYSFFIQPNNQTSVTYTKTKPTEANVRKEWYLRKQTKKDDIQLLYKNIGMYEGENIHVRISVLDWNDLARATSVSGGIFRAPISPSANIRFDLTPGGQKYKYEFLKTATNGSLVPAKVKGYLTFMDIDGTEILVLDPKNSTVASRIERIYQSDENEVVPAGNPPATYPSFTTNGTSLTNYWSNNKFISTGVQGYNADVENSKWAFSTITFEGSELSFSYASRGWLNTDPRKTPASPPIQENTGYYSDYSTFWYYTFMTTSYKARQTEPAIPTKIVTDSDEEGLENTLKKIDEKFKYTVSHIVSEERSEWHFKEYVFKDKLDEALQIEKDSNNDYKIKIYNDLTDADVTNWFTIDQTAAASGDVKVTLKSGNNVQAFYGTTYRYEIEVGVKPGADLTPNIDPIKDKVVFNNIANVEVTMKNNQVVSKDTNEVVTYAPAPGRIQILKVDSEFTTLHLKDAEFEVYKKADYNQPNAVPVYKGKTDEKGTLATDLWKGDYVVKEVTAPDGYKIDTIKEEVTIDQNKLVVPPISVTFTDTLIKPIPKVTKFSTNESITPTKLATAAINEVFDYDIQVENEQTSHGLWTDVVLTDEVPKYLAIQADSFVLDGGPVLDNDLASKGLTITGNKIKWEMGDIEALEVKKLSFKVKVVSTQADDGTTIETIKNEAKATGGDAHSKEPSVTCTETYSDQDEDEIKLRQRYLHIRQVVLNEKEEMVLPLSGYHQAKNSQLAGTAPFAAISSVASVSTTETAKPTPSANLFKIVQVILATDHPWLNVATSIPEYYEYVGHVATTDKASLATDHLAANKSGPMSLPELDYTSETDYWVTVFIQPKYGKNDAGDPEESPRPFSWSHVVNEFGKIKE
ncbi:hypothetical protein I6N95_17525 [Vagococcus sp. BWB3-3]|uniref:SpaA-like prealbumin fold domain-containing protein n=1 Tax=Vagococcus allomyrinae TaxID=2794353 RepID=A0A940PDI1_9ENTE|nr:SpaA isopeptide-forming pilin-related protein [Vagococcus allomyrinae]MBP1042820.1 hypothetical protein [Vagococcus allomyrinae]